MSEKIDVNATKDEIMAFLKRTKVIKVSENRKRKSLKVLREELEAGGHFIGVVGKTGTQYKGNIGAAALREAEKKKEEYQILTNQNPLGFNVKNTIQILGFKKAEDRPPPPSAAEIELSGYGGLPATATASPPASSVDLPTEDYSKGLPVREMRDFLSQVGVNWTGMIKRDLRQTYNEYKAKQAPAPAPAQPAPEELNPYAVAREAAEAAEAAAEQGNQIIYPSVPEEFNFPDLEDPWGASAPDDEFGFSESEEEIEEEESEEESEEAKLSRVERARKYREIIAEGKRQRQAEKAEEEKKQEAEREAKLIQDYNDPARSIYVRRYAARTLGLPEPTNEYLDKQRARLAAPEEEESEEEIEFEDEGDSYVEIDFEGVDYYQDDQDTIVYRKNNWDGERWVGGEGGERFTLVGEWNDDGDDIDWATPEQKNRHEIERD